MYEEKKADTLIQHDKKLKRVLPVQPVPEIKPSPRYPEWLQTHV